MKPVSSNIYMPDRFEPEVYSYDYHNRLDAILKFLSEGNTPEELVSAGASAYEVKTAQEIIDIRSANV